MTIHQLHYTSCEDGLEGIQGFQVSALTAGAPKPLVDLAVRTSAYEVGPGLAAADESNLDTFPVAFGYVRTGRSAALFQTRYTGADFTGRTGNYFAHALLLGDAESELGNTLPIDMWRSPTWVHTRPAGTDLPAAGTLPPGPDTSPPSIRQFLSEPARADGLARMISAVQRVLVGGRGRVVLVVPDDRTAALWLAALCRSFPRPLGLGISFVTYTSRPEDAGVLVSCTTPDVLLPSYGDFTVVDLVETGTAEEPTRYAEMMAALWGLGGVLTAIMPAERLVPPLSPGELETYAVLIGCTADLSSALGTPEQLLLDAVALAVERMPGTLTDAGWRRVADLLRAGGGPADLRRWAELLDAALRRGGPVPAELLGTYYLAALAAPERLWLPQLDAAQLDQVAAEAVLPAMTDPGANFLLDRVAEHPELRAATLRALEHRLADPDQLVPLGTSLTPHAAQVIRKIGGSGRVAHVADVALARGGRKDRVSVLARIVEDGEVDRRSLGPLLWPADVSTSDAERAVTALPRDVLADTGLLHRIVKGTLEQAGRDELGPEHTRLVDALLAPGMADVIPRDDAATLKASALIGHFREATPKDDPDARVADGLRLLQFLSRPAQERLLDALAGYALRADSRRHHELLERSLRETNGQFFKAYDEQARARLAKANPNNVASVIVLWSGVSDKRIRQRLLNETLVAAVARRKSKHLDQIGEQLKSAAVKSRISVSAPKGSWSKWWRDWRSAHEQNKGLLSLLGLRRGR
ncbi:MAG: GTPase-associated protein 1-related protein [Actinophytocola sp.]|uniref:GTPase-associated protein 1-related protein n=1 Tax=Actinophytocola sp. TaxID=1872138 RepID=UPI003D6A460E